MQKVHGVQSKRTPEAWQAAQLRIEQSRQHEVSYRKCKAVKSHAVRSRALAAEGLRQMAISDRPDEHLAVQARWKSAQEVSKSRQIAVMKRADEALSCNSTRKRANSPEARLSDAEEEEDAAMMEVATIVGAANVASMAAIGQEGLQPDLASPRANARSRPGGAVPRRGSSENANSIATLLQQLKTEPRDEAECTAKFLLYEGYAAEVEEMRGTLFKFYEESRPTVPAIIAGDMDKKIKGIDSTEAMGIPDRAREWFVFHMMRQAERNNLNMASILDGFEKKLEFLASNDQDECPICLEKFEEGGAHAAETLGCCHKVCKNCWGNWQSVMHGRAFCPLCRHEDFLGALAERM
jgi:hypothetical protein